MPFNDLSQIKTALDDALASKLVEVVENVEQWIKDNHEWRNDTASAEASIRGFVPGKTPHDKYFEDPRWKAAREGRVSSRYLSKFPENTADHYDIFVVNEDVGEDENTIVGIVTSFIEYQEDIENSLLVGSTFLQARGVAERELAIAFSKPLI